MENDEDRSRPYGHFDSSAVHHKINPDCPICLKPVFWSRHIVSLDRVWHVECFICSYCFKPLRPGEQSYYGGRLYCTEKCFSDLFLGHCTATATPPVQQTTTATTQTIQSTTIAAKNLDTTRKPSSTGAKNPKIKTITTNETKVKENKQSTCLHCTNCERLTINHHHLQHRLTDKYPYCKFPGYKANIEMHQADIAKNAKNTDVKNKERKSDKHDQITMLNRQISDCIGQSCIRCLKKVFAAELCNSINIPLHHNCLRCCICDRILQPAAHAVHDGLPICNFPCYNRIYSFGGYRKGWQEYKP